MYTYKHTHTLSHTHKLTHTHDLYEYKQKFYQHLLVHLAATYTHKNIHTHMHTRTYTQHTYIHMRSSICVFSCIGLLSIHIQTHSLSLSLAHTHIQTTYIHTQKNSTCVFSCSWLLPALLAHWYSSPIRVSLVASASRGSSATRSCNSV